MQVSASFIDEETQIFLDKIAPYGIGAGLILLGGGTVIILGRGSDGEAYSNWQTVGILAASVFAGSLLGHGYTLFQKTACFAHLTACTNKAANLFRKIKENEAELK